jgi:hypothetical protein
MHSTSALDREVAIRDFSGIGSRLRKLSLELEKAIWDIREGNPSIREGSSGIGVCIQNSGHLFSGFTTR